MVVRDRFYSFFEEIELMDFNAMQGECFLVLFKTDFLYELDDWWIIQHYLFDPSVCLLEDSEFELVWI